MALPTPDRHPSDASFTELNEAVATARDALLLFAAAEGVLQSLVCDPVDPDCRYPDLATLRQDVTVDELLSLIAAIPDTGEEDRGEEATALYPVLLELAEAFDVFIEQTSLVHGDAIALAESMVTEWHAMSGCCNEDPSPGEATIAVKRMGANLDALPAVLDSVNRLYPEVKQTVAARFEEGERLPWRSEARHLAEHAIEAWLPQGVSPPQIVRTLEAARAGSTGRTGERSLNAVLGRATADLALGRLVRGVARDGVSDVLEAPFAGVLRG
jgi:hypothetical protein